MAVAHARGTPVEAAAAGFTTTLLQHGCFYNDRGVIFARSVSDRKAALLRPGIFILGIVIVLSVGMFVFTLLSPPGNTNLVWLYVLVILGSALLVPVIQLGNRPRRVVRVHAVSPHLLEPGELLLRVEETHYPGRNRRETRVFDTTDTLIGMLVTEPVNTLVVYTWFDAQGTPTAIAREATTAENEAAGPAPLNLIARALRNRFPALGHRKVDPHTMRLWNLAPIDPASSDCPDPHTDFTQSGTAAPPTASMPTPSLTWAQIQSIRGSPLSILTLPGCPPQHPLIPLVLAESLAKHTLG